MPKEMLDLVSNEDEVVGTAERKECHEEALRHRGIHVFLFNSAGKLFLQKRCLKKDVFPGYYECSLTGHVLAGETYLQAAVREIKEELGLSISKDQLQEMFKFKMLFGKEHEIVTHYRLTSDSKIKIDQSEMDSGRFMEAKEIQKKIKKERKKFHPATIVVFEKYEMINKIF